MKVEWRLRDSPLDPVGLFAQGDTALRLCTRLLTFGDKHLTRWKGVWAQGLMVLLGNELPWVDGICYLGKDPDAPSLLMPTHSSPLPSAELLEQAVGARNMLLPVAILPKERLFIPLAGAQPLHPSMLREFQQSLEEA